MGNGFSSVVVAWQTVVPMMVGATAIFMAKWLSHTWARAAQEKTVRVVSRIGPRHMRGSSGRSRR